MNFFKNFLIGTPYCNNELIMSKLIMLRIMDTAIGSNSQSSTAGAVNSEQSASQNHRQKSDIAWKYCSVGVNSQGRRTLTCGYCFKVIAGGGIHRMKQHLAGEQGSIVPCSKVDPAVRHAILASMKEKEQKSKEKKR